MQVQHLKAELLQARSQQEGAWSTSGGEEGRLPAEEDEAGASGEWSHLGLRESTSWMKRHQSKLEELLSAAVDSMISSEPEDIENFLASHFTTLQLSKPQTPSRLSHTRGNGRQTLRLCFQRTSCCG